MAQIMAVAFGRSICRSKYVTVQSCDVRRTPYDDGTRDNSGGRTMEDDSIDLGGLWHQCEQIGLFLKGFWTNLLTLVAQISVDFWGYLKNVTINCCVDFFGTII